MVKIFNTLRGPDPLGAAFANLGKSLFGDTTANAINSEKLYAAQRENTEMDNLMARAAKSGVQNLGADPIAQAILLGSGYDPSKFGQVGLMGAATGFGAADPRTQNWQVGTGQSYDNTAAAVNAKQAETARNNDMQSADRRYGVDQTQKTERDKFFYTPKEVLNPDGTPGFARQGELAGSTFSPILSETDQKGTLLGQNFDNLPALDPMQRQVLGANPSETSRTPRNYVTPQGSFITYDGVTNAQTGAPLPPGGYIGNVEGGAGDVGLTPSSLSGLQQGQVSYDKFMSTVALAEPLTADPSLFGVQGWARSKAQELIQGIGGVATLAGAREDLARSLVSAETGQILGPDAAKGLIPELYDPRLGEVEALWGILLYQGASALAGQENRSVSDMDVQIMRGILGDPHSFFSSNRSMASKLNVAKALVKRGRAINQQYLQQGTNVPDPQQDGPAGPAPQVAPQSGSPVDALVDKYRSR